jgi:hypothetical protein
MKTPGDRRSAVVPELDPPPQAAADEHERSAFGATPDRGVIHLGVPITVANIPVPLDNFSPLGIAERRVPGRRLSGTVRAEAGPAERLDGLAGTVGIPRHAPIGDPRVPRMEPLSPTPATVIYTPPSDTQGVAICN